MTSATQLTVDDLLSLPEDGIRYELLDGELVGMTPPGGEHGEILITFGSMVRAHVRGRRLGRVLGDVGVLLHRDPDRVRAPDICFISAERLPAGRSPVGYLEVVPDLVVEIVSPNDRAAEVQDKLQEWVRAGARLVWAIYPSSRSVIALRGLDDIRIYTESDELDGSPVLPDFRCPVASLFD